MLFPELLPWLQLSSFIACHYSPQTKTECGPGGEPGQGQKPTPHGSRASLYFTALTDNNWSAVNNYTNTEGEHGCMAILAGWGTGKSDRTACLSQTCLATWIPAASSDYLDNLLQSPFRRETGQQVSPTTESVLVASHSSFLTDGAGA